MCVNYFALFRKNELDGNMFGLETGKKKGSEEIAEPEDSVKPRNGLVNRVLLRIGSIMRKIRFIATLVRGFYLIVIGNGGDTIFHRLFFFLFFSS